MTLSFILGSAKYDHQSKITKMIQDELDANKQHQIFYLVPNHIKFQSEVDLLRSLDQSEDRIAAQSRVQVFSFSRLAWYFLQDTEFYQKTRISTAGLNMLVLSILKKHQDELVLFKGLVAHNGFLEKLTQQLLELQKAQIDEQQLLSLAEQLPNNVGDIQNKLRDLAIILAEFNQIMGFHYIENNAILNALADYLKTQNLKDMSFFISGFAQFNAQEQQIIQTLITNAHNVVIDLISDDQPITELPNTYDLFFQPKRTFLKYKTFAEQKGVYDDPISCDKLRSSQGLEALDQYWIAAYQTGVNPNKSKSSKNPGNIRIIAGENRYEELIQVGQEIKSLVTNQNYRYRDILVLTRHLNHYQTIMKPVFDSLEIPYFIDLPEKMMQHPLASFLDSLFAVDRHHYRYEDIMNLLKTELLLGDYQNLKTYRDDLDLCENEVLKNNYYGRDWTTTEDWIYRRFASDDFKQTVTDQDEAKTVQINQIRHLISDYLPAFFKSLKKAKTSRQAATILYQALIDWRVDKRLLELQASAIENGDLTAADKHKQTWQAFVNLLDEYVDVLGDSQFDLQEFSDILNAGFQGADYAQIPATLDQLAISESGMVQTKNYEVVIMIGSTDQVMPDNLTNAAIISDEDRQALDKVLNQDQFLNDSALLQHNFEPYLNYLAFMSAKKQLIFTYPKADAAGNPYLISPYVEQIKNNFNLKVENNAITALKMTSWRLLLSQLVKVLTMTQENQQLVPKVWQKVYQTLLEQPTSEYLTRQIIAGFSYKNVPGELTKTVVSQLYGNTIDTSVSKLETFYKNEYEYFLKYGLKLSNRPIYELTAANTGSIYHEVVNEFVKMVGDQLGTIEPDHIAKLIDDITSKVIKKPEYAILNRSAEMQFLATQMRDLLKLVGQVINQQIRLNHQKPLQTEVLFGHIGSQSGIKGLQYDLGNNQTINVRGKIDRVDQIGTGDEAYLSVIDYKSGQKDFDLKNSYYGVSLQILTYLDVLKQNPKELTKDRYQMQPAGAFYFYLQNKMLRFNLLNVKQRQAYSQQDYLEMLLAEYKFNGLIVEDEKLLTLLDPNLKKSETSKLYDFKHVAKNDAMKSKQFIKKDQLALLLAHNESLIKQAGRQILSGKIELNPYRTNDRKKTGMQYSDYLSVMQFDPMLSTNQYRELVKDEDAIWQTLKENTKEIKQND